MSVPAASDAAKRYFHGTHRTCAPDETLARLRPLLPAMGITRIANVTGLDRTGVPVVMVSRPNARSVTVSQGKGLTLAAAKASGVMEALEVWHAEHIVKPLKLASHEEMRAEHRMADIAGLPRSRGSRYTPTLPLMWIEGEDLLGAGRVWLPLELVSANYTLPFPPGSGCFQANTNGLASGNHWLEAVSHGVCEVVERDGIRVVVSDWMLPESDGLALCRKIRGRVGAEYVYFILLTSRDASDENQHEAADAGVDDFLNKPLNFAELWPRLRVAERILRYTTQVRQLEEMLPICSYCKKIRDDGNYWQQLESYIGERTGSDFSHSVCPDCHVRIVLPEIERMKAGTRPPHGGGRKR